MDSAKSELLKNLENLWRLWCKYKFGFSKLLEIRENIAILMFEVKGKNQGSQYSRFYKRLQDFLQKFLKLTIQHGF